MENIVVMMGSMRNVLCSLAGVLAFSPGVSHGVFCVCFMFLLE